MSTKRSHLPPVTPEDVASTPERVRSTPNGGHAWKCHYCGQFASSVTAKGLYVCRRHGGSTPRQRGEVGADSGRLARPPGRPITTGKGVRGPRPNVDELVQQYKAEHVDVDATDRHMLRLRAHLKAALSEREGEDAIEAMLLALGERAERLEDFLANQKTVGNLMEANDAIYEISRFAKPLFDDSARFDRFMRATREIERRYARLIRLSTVRAKTRRTNAAVRQLRDFAELLPRVLELLEPRLEESKRLALVARLQREFKTVPLRALQQNTLAALPASGDRRVRDRYTWLDAIADWLGEQGTALDDPDTDSLYLRAYLENMENLLASTDHVEVALEYLDRALATFLTAIGFGNGGRAMAVRDVLAQYGVDRGIKRLERTLKEVIESLRAFGPEIEKRHTRMIELGLVRALGRDQARLAGDYTLQRHLLRRLHAVLLEVLKPEDVEYVEVHVLTRGADTWEGKGSPAASTTRTQVLVEPTPRLTDGD